MGLNSFSYDEDTGLVTFNMTGTGGHIKSMSDNVLDALNLAGVGEGYTYEVLGSGETVSYRLINNLNKKNYCLHVVSCANGRLALKDKVNLIHLQDSFNGLNSKYRAIRENSYDGESFIDSCNSSEIFFFSYPDTCASIYTKFGKYFLGLNERED